MRYVELYNNKVRAVFDTNQVPVYAAPYGAIDITGQSDPGIGDIWNGSVFSPAPIIPARKKEYTAKEFVKALTDTEFQELVTLAKTNDTANAVLEQIRIAGIDFNDARDMTIAARMVTAGILANNTRKDEITG